MSTLKIAVQKSGRLNDESMKLLKDIGISIDNGKDQLKAVSRNFPVEVFYLRNGDIPQYLKDGVVTWRSLVRMYYMKKEKELQ